MILAIDPGNVIFAPTYHDNNRLLANLPVHLLLAANQHGCVHEFRKRGSWL